VPPAADEPDAAQYPGQVAAALPAQRLRRGLRRLQPRLGAAAAAARACTSHACIVSSYHLYCIIDTIISSSIISSCRRSRRPSLRCVWSFRDRLYRAWVQNANIFLESGPENSKRIVWLSARSTPDAPRPCTRPRGTRSNPDQHCQPQYSAILYTEGHDGLIKDAVRVRLMPRRGPAARGADEPEPALRARQPQ
jgi:hypothetical protein